MNIETWNSVSRKLLITRAKLEELKELEKGLLDQLKEAADYTSVRYNGYKLTQSTRKGAIQYKEVPMLKGVDLEPYRGKEIEVWKFSIDITHSRWMTNVEEK